MDTNIAIFAELLFAGLQASVWIGLLAATIYGPRLPALVQFQGFEIVAGIVALSFAYAIGVIVDRVADRIFERWDMTLRKELFRHPTDATKSRIEVTLRAPHFGTELSYARVRHRIVRASAVNFPLVTIIGATYALVRTEVAQSLTGSALLGVSTVAGLSLSWLCYWTWRRTARSQYEQIALMRDLVRSTSHPEA